MVECIIICAGCYKPIVSKYAVACWADDDIIGTASYYHQGICTNRAISALPNCRTRKQLVDPIVKERKEALQEIRAHLINIYACRNEN